MAATGSDGAGGEVANFYELYRHGTLGECLKDAMADMVSEHRLPAAMQENILLSFDRAIMTALATRVKSKANIKGKLHWFRNVDDVWTFVLTDANFKMDGVDLAPSTLKIVACDGRAK